MTTLEPYPVPLPLIRIAQHLKEQKTLHKKFAYQIVIEAKRILNDLPTLVDVPVPEGRQYCLTLTLTRTRTLTLTRTRTRTQGRRA